MTFYARDGRPISQSHAMTTAGQGSNSRLNTARMQGNSTENADRLIRERRDAAAASVSHNDKVQQHYAESAAEHEAGQRELERWKAEQKADTESRKRRELGERWQAETDITVSRSSDHSEDLAAARESFNNFTQRAEGEELAARIFNRIHAPWL
ncbi:hypothetical protein [Streptomyces sp. NRRL S-920]|uniref:hypothetical protein n=1 Tax=Streptomyces sp. NRRL S-920 TaxID=1463921 RepID=UPI0004C7F593|nr:hypothetical protein [Streptomyces sp. NRRL S-920]